MVFSIKDQACIVGVGETEYVRGTDKSALQMGLQAALAAISDAGLKPSDIDGIIGADGEDYAANLGIEDLRYMAALPLGGAVNVAALETAAMALATGRAKYVLITQVSQFYSGRRVREGAAQAGGGEGGGGFAAARAIRNYYVPFGINAPPQYYSWIANRHMHEFGTTHDSMAAVSMAMRKHAQLHPKAYMRGRLMTLEDYHNSRWVCYPYHMLDCCLETDGGASVVLTTPERAKDLPRPPVYIMGAAQGCPYPAQEIPNRPNIFQIGMSYCAPVAFKTAEVKPKDLDFAQIYDCFSFQVIQQIEEMGICKRGEGGEFVKGGRIELGGELPVNTHGGLMSQAHVVAMNHIVEATYQLRHDAGERQVKNAEIGAVTGWGGHGHGALAILRKG